MVSDAGFKTGGATKAVTNGIWILVADHPTKPNCKLLLLDSEGLNDPGKVDYGRI